jgi:hypothetical protein
MFYNIGPSSIINYSPEKGIKFKFLQKITKENFFHFAIVKYLLELRGREPLLNGKAQYS